MHGWLYMDVESRMSHRSLITILMVCIDTNFFQVNVETKMTPLLMVASFVLAYKLLGSSRPLGGNTQRRVDLGQGDPRDSPQLIGKPMGDPSRKKPSHKKPT